jgi:hypothetical protein
VDAGPRAGGDASRWRDGELVGATAAQAFFVRCDRTTMTQNDLDNGRLILLVGVATVGPAEFTPVEIDLHVGRRGGGVGPSPHRDPPQPG